MVGDSRRFRVLLEWVCGRKFAKSLTWNEILDHSTRISFWTNNWCGSLVLRLSLCSMC